MGGTLVDQEQWQGVRLRGPEGQSRLGCQYCLTVVRLIYGSWIVLMVRRFISGFTPQYAGLQVRTIGLTRVERY